MYPGVDDLLAVRAVHQVHRERTAYFMRSHHMHTAAYIGWNAQVFGCCPTTVAIEHRLKEALRGTYRRDRIEQADEIDLHRNSTQAQGPGAWVARIAEPVAEHARLGGAAREAEHRYTDAVYTGILFLERGHLLRKKSASLLQDCPAPHVIGARQMGSAHPLQRAHHVPEAAAQ
ncbi:hypothetical protein G6F65_020560 [Rhizopus arrhizus]|nr:hypothetical protein G6F65_020560 [Rhizopus arrhizus]